MAPTVLRTRNMRVVVYPSDHQPPHVHVIGPEAEAKFRIEDLHCFYCRGFTRRHIEELRAFLEPRKDQLKEAWETYHE